MAASMLRTCSQQWAFQTLDAIGHLGGGSAEIGLNCLQIAFGLRGTWAQSRARGRVFRCNFFILSLGL